MRNVPSDWDNNKRPAITPQQYEFLYGAEAAEIAGQRLTRRRFLRRSILAVGGLSIVASGAGALYMLYPTLAGQFGSTVDIGPKAFFPAATPDTFKLNRAGVFYQESARAFIVHLAKETRYLLTGNSLEGQLADEWFTRDRDGSYWLALYQRCTHLGTTVVFRDECLSFKCPSHGAHFHCDGEYLDGPAPRNMDRFPLSFNNEHILVDTSQLIHVPMTGYSDGIPRLLPLPQGPCMY